MKYENLYDVIPNEVWERFDFEKYYSHEDKILKPYLESQGFTAIRFVMGERDSFGPLSRIVFCTDRNGVKRQYLYG